MSAKGLGAHSVVADNYPTAPHMVERLIEVCGDIAMALLAASVSAGGIVEPTAGDGAILRALAPHVSPTYLHAIELREECRPKLEALGLGSITIGDALTLEPPSARLAITNPPFSIFDDLAMRLRPSSRALALLGRSSWLFGALERHALVEKIGMPDVYGFPERPCFVRVEYRDEGGKLLASGGTDSVGAAWYVWPEPLCADGPQRQVGKTMMLRLPTAAEKAAHVPPRRVITVRAEDWKTKGKRSPVLREEMS